MFWDVYRERYQDAERHLQQEMADHEVFGKFVKQVDPDQAAEQGRRSYQLLDDAIRNDNWGAYFSHLGQQGAYYAHRDVRFASWFEVIRSLERFIIPHLIDAYGDDEAQFELALCGMSTYVTMSTAVLSEAYMSAKEETIVRQREAIRELSTPVLQLRDGLLILPIIGVLDTQRAQQLTHTLLHAIRRLRGRIVVIDVTGVPVVDSQVASYLIQTVDAARLMGAKSILTGLSPEVAQTLVTVGVDLRAVLTLGDLQSGLEKAEHFLGYRVEKHDDTGYWDGGQEQIP
ncbi:MAG TPA: STAS domain-containing protein [Candidatus Sulfomarinibacteraceae bacterium]|nr:STAS domain-containing protein [Candidatus Sulfomarinibacteraceae bacterium]